VTGWETLGSARRLGLGKVPFTRLADTTAAEQGGWENMEMRNRNSYNNNKAGSERIKNLWYL